MAKPTNTRPTTLRLVKGNAPELEQRKGLTLDEVLARRPETGQWSRHIKRLKPWPKYGPIRIYGLETASAEVVDTVTPKGRGKRLDLVAKVDGEAVRLDVEKRKR